MSKAGTETARTRPSDLLQRLYPHNPHVLAGYDPLPLQFPDDSPGLHELAASHGTYAVKLQNVDRELADPFLQAVGSSFAETVARYRTAPQKHLPVTFMPPCSPFPP